MGISNTVERGGGPQMLKPMFPWKSFYICVVLFSAIDVGVTDYLAHSTLLTWSSTTMVNIVLWGNAF